MAAVLAILVVIEVYARCRRDLGQTARRVDLVGKTADRHVDGLQHTMDVIVEVELADLRIAHLHEFAGGL